MNRLKKRTEKRVPRFVFKKINKQLISVAGSVLIVLGSYAVVPVQVLATETEPTQVQTNDAALPTVASNELGTETHPSEPNTETQPTNTSEEAAIQETQPSTTNETKQAQTETEPAKETNDPEEADRQAEVAKTRAQPQPRANTTNEGWEYDNQGTYVEITNYSGDLVDITVPAKIDNLPVQINLGTVLKGKMANENEAVTQTFKIESAGEGEKPVKLIGTFNGLFACSDDSAGFLSNGTLISVDFGNADCSEIENMDCMFGHCTQLQELDLSGWNTNRVQTMREMFYGCSQLKNLNLTGWNTSKVQDMVWMFSGSNNLSKLTLSSDFEFKGNTRLRGLPDATSWWVKDDFAAMYDSTAAFIAAHNNLTEAATNHTYKIEPLTNPTAEGWEYEDKGSYVKITNYTGNLEDITVPAKIYGKPVEIDLGAVLKEQMADEKGVPTKTFKIESAGEKETPVKVTGTCKNLFAIPMSFGNGYNPNNTLTSVDFGNANCSEIKDMSCMFYKCKQLTQLHLTDWDTSNVRNMSYMFANCNQLKKLDLSGMKTNNVQDMTYMFTYSQVQELNVSGWNTGNVQDMTEMFSFCDKLQELDLSDWDTRNVENMSNMFSCCKQLQNLNISGWDTGNVELMDYMFGECTNLQKLDLSVMDTGSVQDMSEMFSYCEQLQELNLSGWNTSNVQDMYEMFCGANLSTLTLSSEFDFNTDHSLSELPDNNETTTYHWVKDDYAEVYDSTDDFTTTHNKLTGPATNHTYKIEAFSNPTSDGWGYEDKGSYMKITSYTGNLKNITVPAKIYGKPVQIDLGAVLKGKMASLQGSQTETFTIESAGEGEKPVKVTGSFKDLFAKMLGTGYLSNTTLTSVDFGNANCKDIKDMSSMFNNCSKLQEVNLSGWETSNIQDMSSMFQGCSQLQELDLSGWNTSKVDSMASMFYECSQLQELGLSGWDTSKVENMSNMFYGCSELQGLNLSGWNTSQVQNMSAMFQSCSALQELDLSSWDTSQVQDMNYMFRDCSELQELDLSSWNTNQVQNMSNMFYGCSQLQELDLSSWDTGKVESMPSMFYGCSELQDLNLSGWNTSQVQSMLSMFQRCSSLQKLDLSGWDTSQVQNMGYMFLECTQLQKLDLSGWKTNNVQGMGQMFSDSDNLSKLILSSDFKFKENHKLRQLPDNAGETTYHWVKDDYEDDYGSTYDFTTAHNKLAGTTTNHVYTIQKQYKVSFDLNNGSGKIPDPQFVFEGKLANNPDYEGTKGDLIFDGWTLNSLPFTFDTPITEPVELVASWRNARYTIKFDANDGEGTMNDQELSVDEELMLPANQFTRNGYDFIGWNKESDGGGDSYFDNEVVKNLSTTEGEQVKLYAQWKSITYTINFDSKNGSPISPKTYTIEQGIDSFETPTRTGYTFEGWYDGGKKVTKIATGETGNRTLEAKWKLETYKVTFNSKGGTQVSNKEYTVEQGIDSFETPTREHYTFEGWYDGDEKVTKIETGETGNRTLIAKWTPVTYKVTFDSKSGSKVSDKEYTIEQGIDSFETPTRTGYAFDGWYDGDEKVTEIKDGETGNRTLEAKWKVETYTVTFDSKNGSPISSKTYTIEKGIDSFDTPTRTGYDFGGWYDGENKVTKIDKGETGNRELSAKWTAKVYKITFDSNEGSPVQNATYTIEQGIDSFKTPTRLGYTFEGWYEGETKVTKIEKGETGNRTLIAKWTPVTYKVTFDSAGGNSVDPMTYTIEETILTLPTPTRKGYKFMGWFEGGKLVTEIPIGGTSDRTLTAKWEIITYTITFEDEGLSPITYTISDKSIALPDGPERSGYRFLGWLISEEKLNRSAQNNNSIVLSLAAGTIGNLRLTAQYEAIKYTLNFNSTGGSAIDPITFTTENSLDKLPEPVRIGYHFLGWYDDETKVTELPKGTIGDKILTAKWKKIKTTEVIEDILKEENQKNRKEQDYTEDSWKNYQEAKKAAEELLKEDNTDPLKAEQVLAKLQAAIQGLTLKNVAEPTPSIEKPTNIPTSKKAYPSAQAKQYPRMNMVTTIWPGFIGTGLVAAVIALIKKNKK